MRTAFFAMTLIVAASNYLVQFPINSWLTWGALPYPISFLITELTNRFYGPKRARQVVYGGFFFAVILSMWFATPRIAFASGTAFLVSQLLDISVFNYFRKSIWWQAPLFASLTASLLDTALFWSLGFWDAPNPWITWALGDFLIKLVLDIALLTPFRLATRQQVLNTLST